MAAYFIHDIYWYCYSVPKLVAFKIKSFGRFQTKNPYKDNFKKVALLVWQLKLSLQFKQENKQNWCSFFVQKSLLQSEHMFVRANFCCQTVVMSTLATFSLAGELARGQRTTSWGLWMPRSAHCPFPPFRNLQSVLSFYSR